MAYEVAVSNAWTDLEGIAEEKIYAVKFLADEYTVDLEKREILSLSCNVPAKTYLSILILHYLSRKLRGLPQVQGEWISFKQLEGGQGYYPAFEKRVIEPVLRKYGSNIDGLLELTERFSAKRVQLADVSVVLDTFEAVPVLITLYRGDDEFGPQANILFDKSIKDIFCTEDIVILAEFVAHHI